MAIRNFEFAGISVSFNEQTDRYNVIRKEYQELSKTAELEAEKLFLKNLFSYSDLLYKADELFAKLFFDYLQKTVWKLVTHKIYDIDEKVLLEIIENERALEYKKQLLCLKREILEIDANRIEKENQNKELVSGAASFSSDMTGDAMDDAYIGYHAQDATYATTAAAKGEIAITGAMATAGLAAVLAIVNSIGKKKDEAKKQAIFESEYNRKLLYAAFRQDVYLLNLTFSSIVNARENSVFYYYPTADKLEEKETFCRNVIRGNFLHDSEQPLLEKNMIESILTVNPYEVRIYSYLLVKNGGVTSDLMQIFEYLGIDMGQLADAFFEEKYGPIHPDTYEEAKELVNTLEENIKEFNISVCSYLEKAKAKSDELFKIRCTFNGYVYDSIEQCDAAKKQYNEFFSDGELPAEMDIDGLCAKYYDTYGEEIFPKNREDIQQLLIPYITDRFKAMKTVEEITPYADEADNRSIEFNDENMSILAVVRKYLKKLTNKAKFNAMTGAAMDKGKELLSKVPFGKKKNAGEITELNSGDEREYGTEANQQAENVMSSEADSKQSSTGAFANAKNLFGKRPSFFGKKSNEEADAGQMSEDSQNNAGQANAVSRQMQTQNPTNTKTCPKCGNAVKAEGKFCGKCGYRF